jgi:hypothetical protein
MSVYQWTADDVRPTAEEYGYDPDALASYMNELEAIQTEKWARRRDEDRADLRAWADLARSHGITTAAAAWDEEFDRQQSWDDWRSDPSNHPYPG